MPKAKFNGGKRNFEIDNRGQNSSWTRHVEGVESDENKVKRDNLHRAVLPACQSTSATVKACLWSTALHISNLLHTDGSVLFLVLLGSTNSYCRPHPIIRLLKKHYSYPALIVQKFRKNRH